MTLDGAEFLRRFLLHAVPTGFMRIRHFGLLANRVRSSNLAICRQLLNAQPPANPMVLADHAKQHHCCPECKCGTLHAGPNLSPLELHRVTIRMDTS
jgi:Putative transposase